MDDSKGRIGRRKQSQGPPPKVFLGIGQALFLINHLSVVFGPGLQPEALMFACWLTMMGAWVQFAGPSFDAVWRWAAPSGKRVMGFVVTTFIVAFALAMAIAWFGYTQRLLA